MENEIMEQNQQIKRSPFFRICMGILWLIPVYFITNMIIGSIIGAIAGIEAQNNEMAYSAGYAASTAFFQQYGRIVFAFQVIFTALLSFFGILPGTGRFKRKKKA